MAIKLQNYAEFKQNADSGMVETKNQISDGELVLKIAGYNAQAFEQLYSRYSSFLYGLIKKIIGEPKLSEQILLNVFAIFWKRIEQYDTTSNNVFTFLSMLTRNRAVDILKRMDEHKLAPLYDDNYENEKILPKLSPVIKPITLELALAFSERIKFYKSQLTEVQNLVLNQVFFEGLTDEEISRKLNIPEATVKQKIQTTLGTLMHNLSGKNPEAAGNKKIIDLLKLEAVGRLSQDEKEYLTNQKLEDPEFPWAILGEYQNLVALLSSVVVPENPPTDLTGEIKNLFGNVLIGKTELYNVVIPNKINIASAKETKSEEPVESNLAEEFPIRFKEPSKQDLEILEEISQAVPEPVKVAEEKKEEIPVEKKPVVVENKIQQAPVIENRPQENSSLNKKEIAESKIESKPPVSVQNKISQNQKTEIPKQPINIEPSIVDPATINKKINQILSKTEAIKEKNKLVEEKKSVDVKHDEIKPDLPKQESKAPEQKNILKEVTTESKPAEKTNIKELNKILDKAEQTSAKEEKPKEELKKPVEHKHSVKEEKPVETKTEKKPATDDHQIEKLIEDYKHNYEKEIGVLQKKLRRNIMITVGIIVLLLGGGAAIFLSMQKEPAKLVSGVEKPVVNQSQLQNTMVESESDQSNQTDSKPNQSEQINTQQPLTQPTKDQQSSNLQNNQQTTEQKKKDEQKVVYPPLPEAPKIIDQITNGDKKNEPETTQKPNDVVSNKTEKKTEEVAPPKEEKPLTEEPSFFVAVEEPPQPIGGLAGIQQKIVYPLAAKNLGIEGKVLIQAIIDENGNVVKAKVIKGIGSGCDEAALAAVKSSKFIPGKQRGKNVRVQITIPIVFKL
ncbi:TonB family protein [Ignavibacterium album]|nr:TonB family protein [Ignavibacterium album]